MQDLGTRVLVSKPVDRSEQINKFNDVLNRIRRNRPVSSTLFEWYGPPGIGKSTLINLLQGECKKKKVPWILVDFAESGAKARKYLDDPTVLLQDMLADLVEKVQIDRDSLSGKIEQYRISSPPQAVIRAYFKLSHNERLYNKPDWLTTLQEVTIEFVGLIRGLTQLDQDRIQPIAIFFDETEEADIELVDWIEEKVINPLVQLKHCVIVWTARRPWRWKRPEIRQRLQSERLPVFEEEEVKEQFRSSSSTPDLAELFFKNIHVVTDGHPFANAVVISQLNAWEAQGQALTSEYFSGHEMELLREIFHHFIRDYAFKKLKSDEQTACELLALVRLFDTTMLRKILKACGGEEFKEWSQEDFGDLLLRLKKTQLLVWDKGYALDPALRYLIRNYFSVCEVETYLEINRVALVVYQNWLEKPVDNRNLFVIEELYHYASLHQAGEQVNLEAEMAKRLQQYFGWIKDNEALRNALERLEGELKHDSELKRLTSGISSTTLVEQIQIFLAELPV